MRPTRLQTGVPFLIIAVTLAICPNLLWSTSYNYQVSIAIVHSSKLIYILMLRAFYLYICQNSSVFQGVFESGKFCQYKEVFSTQCCLVFLWSTRRCWNCYVDASVSWGRCSVLTSWYHFLLRKWKDFGIFVPDKFIVLSKRWLSLWIVLNISIVKFIALLHLDKITKNTNTIFDMLQILRKLKKTFFKKIV